MIIIRATFEGTPNKHYNYLCRFTTVKVGQKVIVESPYNGYCTVEIVAIHNVGDREAGRPTKEVVNIIDDREYLERKKARARLAEIAEGLAKREQAVKLAQDNHHTIDYQRFAPLAQVDAVASKLVQEAVLLEHSLADRRQIGVAVPWATRRP